jgi:glycosyltransferase involved in cell wall biosynthesis
MSVSKVRDMLGRNRLAVIGGFSKVPLAAAQGALQASFRLCHAIAETGRFEAIDVFHEDVGLCRDSLQLPGNVPCRLLERTKLRESSGLYRVIYVANGEQGRFPPHLLRPDDDPVPVVCEVGTTHQHAQWRNLFLAAWSGAIRASDGLIFKASFAEATFRNAWQHWRREGVEASFPTATVIPNGVDLAANRRDERLRADTRRALGLGPDDVAFLTFSRLGGTKGDYRALLLLWRQVIARHPRGVLVLSGRCHDRAFLLLLRALARETGIANNVIMAEDPYEVWTNARERLMSAADVFVHLSTSAEEVCSNSILESMAFELPVISSHWAGAPELVESGHNGFLVPTYVGEPPPALQRLMLAREPVRTNEDLVQLVACDAESFIAAACVLLEQPETRLAMGQQSRLRVSAQFSLEQVAIRRVAFFDALAAQAGSGAPDGGWPRTRDLVDLGAVLRSMGTWALSPQDQLALSGSVGGAAGLMRTGPTAPGPSTQIELMEAVLRQAAGPLAAGELVRRVTALSGQEQGRAWASCNRALIQLISCGVVSVVRAEQFDEAHVPLAAS